MDSDRGRCCAPVAMRAETARTDVVVRSRTRDRDDIEGGMVRVPAGTFLMGCNDVDGFVDDGEGPVREVALSSYLIDSTAVRNREFAEFVEDTGYVTDAERIGWSFVFHALLRPEDRRAARSGVVADAPWWLAVDGACWRAPEGRDSNVEDRAEHPVVHVSWRDAAAFAAWRGKRLPTEAEWERAARGGLQQARYPWGDELKPEGRHRCNIWQGRFPDINTGEDGFLGTAPVDAFAANDYGLYNTSGNVWEWCADWWSASWHVPATRETRNDPRGPNDGTAKVIRGGSYLCHASYCNRYRVAARTHNGVDSSTGHMGFRCAADVAAD
jgi:sulfatase modifying factor 1